MVRGAKPILPKATTARVGLRSRRLPLVTLSIPIFDVRRIIACNSQGEIERRLVHRGPQFTVVGRCDQVHVSAAHAPLVSLRAQINPAPGGIDVVDHALVFHFADAAEGDRYPVWILVCKQAADDIDIRDHAPHRRFRVRSGHDRPSQRPARSDRPDDNPNAEGDYSCRD